MRLRHLIFSAFLLVSWLPVIGFTAWVHDSAFDQEAAAVEDKHLLLSQHLTRALARYVTDAETAFATVVSDLAAGHSGPGQQVLLAGLHFRRVVMLDAEGREIAQLCPVACHEGAALPLDGLRATIARARDRSGQVVFSNVTANAAGEPAVYLVRSLEGGGLALGELSSTYLAELQGSVAFGGKGHAAIVDRSGRVLAHPRGDWVSEMKDISAVSAVAAMKEGRSGVARFHSPALGEDMIAGFSTVPGVGWGVMVPQPLSELRARARDVTRAAVVFGLAALIATGLASWLLAAYVDRSIKPILAAARLNEEGSIGSEAIGLPRRAPRELRELAEGFNAMARRIREAFAHEREALEEARRAKDTNRAKSEFLATVSHEFRTPLNAIMGFSEMLREQILGPVGNPRYAEYAEAIHSSGAHLLGLIDDVLDISRTELGRVTPREEVTAVAELLDEAMAMVREAHRHERHERRVVVEPGLPAVRGDRQMLRQILINLLSNAEKFTPDGGRITLAARRTADGGIELSVSDTGVGIDPRDIDLVLSPFGRVANRLRAKPGTGLGLTLAKSLAELHGGSLRISSEPGEGTMVRVTLPAERIGDSARDSQAA